MVSQCLPWVLQLSLIATLMLLVANLASTKLCKKTEKWLKLWHMGTHLTVLSESYPMNTNMTGIKCFSKNLWVLVIWVKVAPPLEGSATDWTWYIGLQYFLHYYYNIITILLQYLLQYCYNICYNIVTIFVTILLQYCYNISAFIQSMQILGCLSKSVSHNYLKFVTIYYFLYDCWLYVSVLVNSQDIFLP